MATLRDAVFGQAIGDALGVPYEFKRRDSFTCTDMTGCGTHGKPAGTWSDDTSMALALCDSYRELGRVDTGDILERFKAWRNKGAYTVDGLFDIGITTSIALDRGRHGPARRYPFRWLRARYVGGGAVVPGADEFL